MVTATKGPLMMRCEVKVMCVAPLVVLGHEWDLKHLALLSNYCYYYSESELFVDVAVSGH